MSTNSSKKDRKSLMSTVKNMMRSNNKKHTPDSLTNTGGSTPAPWPASSARPTLDSYQFSQTSAQDSESRGISYVNSPSAAHVSHRGSNPSTPSQSKSVVGGLQFDFLPMSTKHKHRKGDSLGLAAAKSSTQKLKWASKKEDEAKIPTLYIPSPKYDRDDDEFVHLELDGENVVFAVSIDLEQVYNAEYDNNFKFPVLVACAAMLESRGRKSRSEEKDAYVLSLSMDPEDTDTFAMERDPHTMLRRQHSDEHKGRPMLLPKSMWHGHAHEHAHGHGDVFFRAAAPQVAVDAGVFGAPAAARSTSAAEHQAVPQEHGRRGRHVELADGAKAALAQGCDAQDEQEHQAQDAVELVDADERVFLQPRQPHLCAGHHGQAHVCAQGAQGQAAASAPARSGGVAGEHRVEPVSPRRAGKGGTAGARGVRARAAALRQQVRQCGPHHARRARDPEPQAAGGRR